MALSLQPNPLVNGIQGAFGKPLTNGSPLPMPVAPQHFQPPAARQPLPAPALLHPSPVLNYQQPQNRLSLPLLNTNSPFKIGTFPINAPKITITPSPATPVNFVQSILRAVPEAATSLFPGQKTYTPGPGIQRNLFGSTPVQNIEKKTVNNFQTHANLPLPQRIALASGEALGSVANDAATVLPVGKVAGAALKEGAPAVAKVIVKAAQAANDAKVPLNEVGAVGKNVLKLTPQEMAMAEKAGFTPEMLAKATGPDGAKVKVTTPAATVTNSPPKAVFKGRPSPIIKAAKLPSIIPNSASDVSGAVKVLGSKVTNLRKIGTASSKELADRMENISSTHQDLRAKIGNSETSLPTWNKLSKEESANAAQVIQGIKGVKPLSDKVATAVGEAKTALASVHKAATDAGIKVGTIKNYFPHIFSSPMKPGTPEYNAAVGHLVKTGQAANETTAKDVLNTYLRQSKGPATYSNLSKSRTLDIPGYRTDKQVLNDYIDHATRSVAEAQHFGPKNEIANKLIQNIGKEGGDTGLATKAVTNYLHDAGAGSGATSKTLGLARGVYGTARLGKAVISHAGQTSNVALVTRGQDLAKSLATRFTGENRAFIREADVNNPANIHGLADQTTGLRGAMSKATAPLLSQMMQFNRGVSAVAGREYGRFLASAGKADELRELGVTGDIGKTLTHDQELQAARGVTNKTMFNADRAATPVSAETPVGKTVGQYRLAYAYKQTGLIYNQVIKEAANGNLKPLAKFIALSAPVAAGTVVVKNKLGGSNDGPGGIAATTAGNLGGIPGELIDSAARYGKNDVLKTVASDVAPLAGEAVALGEKTQKLIKGNPRPIEGYAAGLAPIVGSRLNARVNPYTPSAPKAVGTPGTVNPDGTKNLTTAQRIKQSFTTADDKKFLALSDDQKKTAAESDPATAEIYKEWLAAKSAFKSMPLTSTTDPGSLVVIHRDARLTPAGKVAYNNLHPDAQYQLALAKYNDNKASGKLTQAQDIAAQYSLAKAQVGADFDKNTRDFYGLTKSEINNLVTTDPNGKDIASKLIAYDNALYKAGFISTPKFKNGFDTNATSNSGSSGSSGSSTNRFIAQAQSYAKDVSKTPSLPSISSTGYKAPAKVSVRARSSSVGKQVKVTSHRVRLA